jgi:hypothetical protein
MSVKQPRRRFLLFVLAPALAAQTAARTVRGILTLTAGGRPALRTSSGALVYPDGDPPTRGVLRDKRLLGMDMELAGTFDSADRFTVNPIHTRSIFVYKNGKRLMVTYWCDVCAIRTYTPGQCWCCQEETALDLREKDDAP